MPLYTVVILEGRGEIAVNRVLDCFYLPPVGGDKDKARCELFGQFKAPMPRMVAAGVEEEE